MVCVAAKRKARLSRADWASLQNYEASLGSLWQHSGPDSGLLDLALHLCQELKPSRTQHVR